MMRLLVFVGLLAAGLFSQSPASQSPPSQSPVTQSSGKAEKGGATKGPLAYTTKSIARGKQFYLIHCVECHDQDGKGLGRRDFNGTPPADLTNPDEWQHGVSAEAIFSSIREGTKGDMPSFKDKLQDEQTWHIVNFIRSLWPESKRPKLETAVEPK